MMDYPDYEMERGAVLIAPVASSTTLHGFVRHFHNLPVTNYKTLNL